MIDPIFVVVLAIIGISFVVLYVLDKREVIPGIGYSQIWKHMFLLIAMLSIFLVYSGLNAKITQYENTTIKNATSSATVYLVNSTQVSYNPSEPTYAFDLFIAMFLIWFFIFFLDLILPILKFAASVLSHRNYK